MNAEEAMKKFQDNGYEAWLSSRNAGVKNRVERKTLWVKVERDSIREAAEFLKNMADEYPHFSIISCSDEGEYMCLNYHFTLSYARRLQEFIVTLKVDVPKDDLRIDSIADIFPAIIYSEREIKEMAGVEFNGIPDDRHMFLTKDFPSGVYPWRRDETAPKETNKLYERWKNGA
ncbi:MAG: NADH-quinone oxidoreductase subunit C [Thermoplasmata archaeon]|nr:NADH-quinone oxidoreductase subunit C [Thermoplasmata archaeon]